MLFPCNFFYLTCTPVAQVVENRVVLQEVARSNLDLINPQDLKITEEKVLPL